ncbi:fibrous sheath CABYR-binding protein-like [Zingiber officinale]|uniref:fibrous sheath CABYR-binding protein-like n=1 Tax=Zingiber officinale TaxID=94328 RepID=UPI001C4CDB1B|nr:fibrous sheath CABYR-binding protein-like [Zingiber officinale]
MVEMENFYDALINDELRVEEDLLHAKEAEFLAALAPPPVSEGPTILAEVPSSSGLHEAPGGSSRDLAAQILPDPASTIPSPAVVAVSSSASIPLIELASPEEERRAEAASLAEEEEEEPFVTLVQKPNLTRTSPFSDFFGTFVQTPLIPAPISLERASPISTPEKDDIPPAFSAPLALALPPLASRSRAKRTPCRRFSPNISPSAVESPSPVLPSIPSTSFSAPLVSAFPPIASSSSSLPPVSSIP